MPDESGISVADVQQMLFKHRHSGSHGDGPKVAGFDTAIPFSTGKEPTYVPVNAPLSGRKYRIQIIEVLDENSVLQPVLQVVPV